jgi:hypothetical protein
MAMFRIWVPLLASSLALPAAAMAAPDQAASPATSERRLSPDQIEKVLDDAARKREQARLPDESLPPPIHGEVGFSVGTGGYRSAYGTAVVPLTGDGVAILSVGVDRLGSSRDTYYRER